MEGLAAAFVHPSTYGMSGNNLQNWVLACLLHVVPLLVYPIPGPFSLQLIV
jgi:hypothetical protein